MIVGQTYKMGVNSDEDLAGRRRKLAIEGAKNWDGESYEDLLDCLNLSLGICLTQERDDYISQLKDRRSL